ncbi:MAG: terpene cyclase/mutase family protein [Bacteroidales bacterium]|nr:terpene cyclase/mutase family protein [Bacteroidales bacterium]
MKKQELLSDITSSLNKVSTLIGHEKKTMKISNKEVVHFPLFFSEQVAPNINMEYMDSCATALGLITYKLLHNTKDEEKEVVNKSIRAILKMQNPDKSWSSVLYQGNDKQKKQLDGIIIETCFALNALIECSFLDKEYLYDENVLTEFQINDLSDRINFVVESVKWLDQNKEDNGWYYTTTKHFTETDSILPTASATISVINTLHQISSKFEALQSENIQIKQQDFNLIKTLIHSALKALFDMQKSSGGFSKKRGDAESIAQTSNALVALLQLETNYIQPEFEPKIELSIKWFLSKVNNIYDDEKVDVTDYFDEYDQIIEEEQRPLKRPIRHETHIDSYSFLALLSISQSKKYMKSLSSWSRIVLYYHIKKSYHHLMKLQTDDGQFSGAFECRRKIQSEKYPIYSTYQAIVALKIIQNDFETFYKSYSTMRKYYYRLGLLLLTVIVFGLVLVFGNNKSKWVVFALSVAGNIAAQPIIQKMNFRLW